MSRRWIFELNLLLITLASVSFFAVWQVGNWILYDLDLAQLDLDFY